MLGRYRKGDTGTSNVNTPCVGVGQAELFSGEDSPDSEPLGEESPGLREVPLLRLLPGRQG